MIITRTTPRILYPPASHLDLSPLPRPLLGLSNPSSLLRQPGTHDANPRRRQKPTPHRNRQPTKDLEIQIIASWRIRTAPSDQRARYRIPRQPGKSRHEERGPDAHPNLPHVRDLRDERGQDCGKAAERQAVQHGEDEGGRVRVHGGRDPDREHEDEAEEGEEYRDVEPPHVIARPERQHASGKRRRVDDGDEVEREIRIHA